MWPNWLKRTFWWAVSLLSVFTGISLTAIPSMEVSYVAERNNPICVREGGCIGLYKISVGNTGRRLIDTINVRIDPRIVEETIIPLKVLDSGVVPRHYEAETKEGNHTITIKELPSGRRVDITFVLRENSVGDLPDPYQLLHDVTTSSGIVTRGAPDTIRFGRFLFALFQL